jgi:hypothetical protein
MPVSRSTTALFLFQSSRLRGRPACGRPHTTPDGKRCTATPRCPATHYGHKAPNASAGRMPRTLRRLNHIVAGRTVNGTPPRRWTDSLACRVGIANRWGGGRSRALFVLLVVSAW